VTALGAIRDTRRRVRDRADHVAEGSWPSLYTMAASCGVRPVVSQEWPVEYSGGADLAVGEKPHSVGLARSRWRNAACSSAG